jgi:hypothetical protein
VETKQIECHRCHGKGYLVVPIIDQLAEYRLSNKILNFALLFLLAVPCWGVVGLITLIGGWEGKIPMWYAGVAMTVFILTVWIPIKIAVTRGIKQELANRDSNG